MSHLSIIDQGHRLPNFSKKLYDSSQRLTRISILPVAIIGRPPTNIQVNRVSANLLYLLHFCWASAVQWTWMKSGSFPSLISVLIWWRGRGDIIGTFTRLITVYTHDNDLWFWVISRRLVLILLLVQAHDENTRWHLFACAFADCCRHTAVLQASKGATSAGQCGLIAVARASVRALFW